MAGAAAEKETHINELPDEMLCKVFANLSIKEVITAHGVCQRWHELCRDLHVWQNRDIKVSYEIKPKQLYAFCIYANITKLNISGVQWMHDPAILKPVLEQCPFLESLYLPCNINDFGISLCVSICPNLKHLSVAYICNTALKKIAKLKKLEFLELMGTEGRIPLKTYQKIFQNCSKLTSLSFAYCKLKADDLECFSELSSNLKYLQIIGFISSRGIAAIGNFEAIKELDLDVQKLNLDERALSSLSWGCPNLTSLSMAALKGQVDMTAFQEFFKHATQLTSITFGGLLCQDQYINVISANNKKLMSFHLIGYASEISYNTFVTLSKELTDLASLELEGCYWTNLHLYIISLYCFNLETLILHVSSRMDDFGLKFLPSLFLRKLTNFKMSFLDITEDLRAKFQRLYPQVKFDWGLPDKYEVLITEKKNKRLF